MQVLVMTPWTCSRATTSDDSVGCGVHGTDEVDMRYNCCMMPKYSNGNGISVGFVSKSTTGTGTSTYPVRSRTKASREHPSSSISIQNRVVRYRSMSHHDSHASVDTAGPNSLGQCPETTVIHVTRQTRV
jgi:hypothetical protein